MSRKRSHYRPKPVFQNPIQAAMAGASLIKAEDQANVGQILAQALDAMRTGINALDGWRSLADAMNVAEELANVGICSDQTSRCVIQQAQDALGAVQERHASRGSWTLRAAELQALSVGVEWHMLQLGFCSLNEYERATRRVREKVRQALAGNAGPGVKVIEGGL